MATDGQSFLKATRPALESNDLRGLTKAVNAQWTNAELCEFLANANVDVRRVAAVVIGYVGDMSNVACLAYSLHDVDEQVNHMAEHGLWNIWFRGGNPQSVRPFRDGVAHLAAENYPLAIDAFRQATRIDPDFAEAYNQCAIAHFFEGDWKCAIKDCMRTVERVPQHFGAMSGMGHCYAQMNDLPRALKCYRHALNVNPRMPAISLACEKIEACLRNKSNEDSGMFNCDRLRV